MTSCISKTTRPSSPLRDRSSNAIIEENYRFVLKRTWGPADVLVFCMLNPSTADAAIDDPTIRKCIGFAKRRGFGGIVVVNLCPWRATDPKDLYAAHKRGEDVLLTHVNLEHIHNACKGRLVVLAWGNGYRPWMTRPMSEAVESAGNPVCLGRCKSGAPRHPLMVSYETDLEPWGTR